IRREPKDTETQVYLGGALGILSGLLRTPKDCAEAEIALRAFIRLKPEDAEAYFSLAQAQLAQREWEGARDALDRSIAIIPNRAPPRLKLAWLLSTCPDPRSHDFPRALEQARTAIEIEK